MRLGCLPYLNVKPLVYPFEHGGLPAGWKLVYAPPSQLAEMLSRDEIAAAPVSSFATFADRGLDICPGICIAARGKVKSVLLISKVPVHEITTIALDDGSLSGRAMLRIILTEIYELHPTYARAKPEPVAGMLKWCDAAMVIGNPAMQFPKDDYYVLDIGQQWNDLTGLPAVFALWAGRGITDELVQALHDAKDMGTTRREEIAAEESAKLGLPYDVCLDYLSQVMVYDLGEEERRGLEVFHEKCVEHKLVLPERVM